MSTKAQDQKELLHVNTLREIQKSDPNVQYFETWKQLNNLICDITLSSFVLNKDVNIHSQPADDSVSTD